LTAAAVSMSDQNAGQKRAIEELERDNKLLRRDNKNLREALAAWKQYADNPQRGLLGRWRR
jgi:cell division protein FtsB